ncbi:MAG: chromophore lyase [Prevotella sp.]|nr:chromophore lyase [Prevotella sp.]
MKRQALITIVLLCQCLFALAGAEGLSPYDKNAPVGWGTVDGGITGSDDENPVTVSTLAELKSAMSGTGKKTIYVKGTIEFQGLVSFSNVQNKTVYGLPGSVLSNPTLSAVVSESGILQLKNCKNIILRNLTFKAAGAYDIDGNDNLTLAASEHIWIDHCDFQDGVDGNLDCNNGADYICITWTRFHYLISPWSGGSGGSNDHRFTNLWGGSDNNIAKDGGKLRTTFANCWWDEGCKERMPRIRFGQVHILNCLYSSSVANYCVGAGYRCNAYIENCAFTSSKTKSTPWKKYATKSGYTDFNITLTGNLNVKDAQSKSGDIEYFVPSDIYTYESYDAAEVEAVVSDATNGAGATLTIEEGQPFTAIEGVTTGSSTVVSTQYYDLQGRLLESPKKGLQLRTEQMSDGRRITTKIIR